VDENEKVSEKNWLHTASATAKRFSSTSEYTDLRLSILIFAKAEGKIETFDQVNNRQDLERSLLDNS
jgi:hypothetical protein